MVLSEMIGFLTLGKLPVIFNFLFLKSDPMRFLLITIILIAYGSLYPLEFMSPADFSIQISKLTDFRFWNSGISDAIANFFLFIPFGIAIQNTFKMRSFKVISGLVAITFIYAFLV